MPEISPSPEPESAPIRAQSAKSAANRRGGPRPGAGAPRGNLNALKHGRTSRQQARLLQALIDIPEARDALIALNKRNRLRRKQAEEGAGVLMTRLLEQVARAMLLAENNQPQNNQEFLAFLNTATAEIRTLLEKQPKPRRASIKRPAPQASP